MTSNWQYFFMDCLAYTDAGRPHLQFLTHIFTISLTSERPQSNSKVTYTKPTPKSLLPNSRLDCQAYPSDRLDDTVLSQTDPRRENTSSYGTCTYAFAVSSLILPKFRCPQAVTIYKTKMGFQHMGAHDSYPMGETLRQHSHVTYATTAYRHPEIHCIK